MNKLRKDSNMRNAMLRVSAVNEVKLDSINSDYHAGDIVTYSEEDIEKKLQEWSSRNKSLKYFFIKHDEYENNVHYHIILNFENSVCKFSTIKNMFPFGDIEPCKFGVKKCVEYLTHRNAPEKFQHSWDKIKTNAPDKLELYKIPGKTTVNIKLQKYINDIVSGKLQEFEVGKIEPDIYIRFEKRIKSAFEYRQKILKADHTRDVQVIVLQGPPRCGKSLFCKVWAEKRNKSICFSSASNDPWQDYGGQDVFVYDDFDYHSIRVADFTKALDVHNNTSIRARYKNPIFLGDTIFICTNIPIIEWFKEDEEELRQPVFDRISSVLDFQDYKLKFNPNIVPKNDRYRDLNLSYAVEEFRKRLLLKDGVARYTTNEIANLIDIEDKYQHDYALNNIASHAGRFLLCKESNELFTGERKYRYLDLKKYVDYFSDKERKELFIKQLDDI